MITTSTFDHCVNESPKFESQSLVENSFMMKWGEDATPDSRIVEIMNRWFQTLNLLVKSLVKIFSSQYKSKTIYTFWKKELDIYKGLIENKRKQIEPKQAKTSKNGREYFRLGAESYSSLGRVEKKFRVLACIC